MAWWNDFVTWFNSASGSRVFLSAILPFLAIVVAGVIAALIGRESAKRVLSHQDRELKGAAIIALIVVGRKASIWTSLGGDERQHIDSLMTEADIRVRLIPVNGASLAAEWAAHELADMKKNSASFSFQAEQTFVDYRDRLLDWQHKPGRARKLFASDLQQWRYDDDSTASAAPREWTPASVLPAPVVPASTTPAPVPTSTGPTSTGPTSTGPTPTGPTPFAPATAPVEPSTSTDSTSAIPPTPGLSTAPPPTTTPMEAPAPAGVVTSAPVEDASVEDASVEESSETTAP